MFMSLGPQISDISVNNRKGANFLHWTIWGPHLKIKILKIAFVRAREEQRISTETTFHVPSSSNGKDYSGPNLLHSALYYHLVILTMKMHLLWYSTKTISQIWCQLEFYSFKLNIIKALVFHWVHFLNSYWLLIVCDDILVYWWKLHYVSCSFHSCEDTSFAAFDVVLLNGMLKLIKESKEVMWTVSRQVILIEWLNLMGNKVSGQITSSFLNWTRYDLQFRYFYLEMKSKGGSCS